MAKKRTFKVVQTIDKMAEIIVEEYDEFTYYYSPRFDGKLQHYALYDKEVGFAIALGKSKRDLLKKYAEVTERYKSIRENPQQYNKLKTKYASLCINYEVQDE